MMPNNGFPGDVVIEILSRLPAESLVRFKCMLKSWYALLQDSKFVALHLRNHTLTNNKSLHTLLLGSRESTFNTCNKVFLSMFKYDGEVALCAVKDEDLSSVLKSRVFHICSPYDGIVCFGDFFDRVVIANPGIRQFRALPKSCIPLPAEDDPAIIEYVYGNCHQKTIALGFGTDLKSKDYKVVRISIFVDSYDEPIPKYEDNLGHGVLRYDAEVYTIGSNSWRQIEDAYPFDCIFCCDWLSSYWNGAYCWCARKLLDGKFVYEICSFDFSDEIFKFITIPEYILLLPPDEDSLEAYGIIEFNGSLAILCHRYMEIQSYFDIWVMDGFGDGSTWTMILYGQPNISRFTQTATPLGFLEKYQLVLIIDGKLSSYDFVTNQVKILPSNGDNQLIYYTGINYRTSLVSIVDNENHVDG